MSNLSVEVDPLTIECSRIIIPVCKVWEVRTNDQLKNRVKGRIIWNAEHVGLWMLPKQKTGQILCKKFRLQLQELKLLDANVLDFLLKHPWLIPEAWKGNSIYFWGTIYRNRSERYVRVLFFGEVVGGEDAWRDIYVPLSWYIDNEEKSAVAILL